LIEFGKADSAGAGHERTGMLLDDGRESRRYLAFAHGRQDQQAQSENTGRGRHSFRLGLHQLGVGRPPQHCDRVGRRHQLVQQFKALSG
jgi:hypothetical protein